MFHRGEVIGHQGEPDGEWESLTVVTGWCDWPATGLVFACRPGERPWRYLRGNPPGVLAVLRRQSDGQRFLLDSETLELHEQAEGGMKHFDRKVEREVPSQFDDATKTAGPPVARRAISVGGRTVREPARGD